MAIRNFQVKEYSIALMAGEQGAGGGKAVLKE
jgi:hypothetical protein